MKWIKLLCFALLAAIGFIFTGENFILYLGGFEDQCIYTTFYTTPSSETEEEDMVNDIIREAENAGIGIFTVVGDNASPLRHAIKIYAANGADEFIKENCQVDQKQYRSLLLGICDVEFYSFDKLIDNNENIADIRDFYITGDMESAREFNAAYGGKFPKPGVRNNSDMYVFGIWSIIAVVVLFLTCFEIQFNRKECYVCVTLGTNISRLLLKFLLPDLIVFFAVFFTEYAILGRFTNTAFMFQSALLAFILMVCLDIIFYTVGFGTFQIKKAFSGLSLTNRQLRSAYALKLVTMVIALLVISSNISQIDSVFKYYQLSDFFDMYSDYSFIALTCDLDEKADADIDEVEYDYTVRYTKFYLKQHEEGNSVALSYNSVYVIADSGAFKYLSNKIDEMALLDSSKEFSILIPKNINKDEQESISSIISNMNEVYSEEKSAFVDLERSYEIVYYEGDVNICGITTYGGEIDFCKNVKNPIILYIHDYDSVDEKINTIDQHEGTDTSFLASPELKMPEFIYSPYSYNALFNTPDEELQEFVNSHNADHNPGYVVTNAKEMYEYYKKTYDKILMLNSVASILAILLEIIVSITIIRTEYNMNARELFIRKTMGYSAFQNNKHIILYSVIPLSIFIVVSFALYLFGKIDIMLYYALIGILLLISEMLFICLFILKMEKVSTNKIIKGGTL